MSGVGCRNNGNKDSSDGKDITKTLEEAKSTLNELIESNQKLSHELLIYKDLEAKHKFLTMGQDEQESFIR